MGTAGATAGREELEEELEEECLRGEAGWRSAAVLLLTCNAHTHIQIEPGHFFRLSARGQNTPHNRLFFSQTNKV